MEKKINERLIRISGKSPISKDLELGRDVEILIKGNIVKEEKYDNNDGTVNLCWILKPLEVEVK